MDSTKYTTSCKLCHYKATTELHGPLQHLAYYISTVRFFVHFLIHHPDRVTLRAVWEGLVVIGCGLAASVLILLRLVAYIFYPFYLLLDWLYN